jgi:hypothetical protein
LPTFTELKSKCTEAMTTSPLKETEESVSVLYQNDWVRILAVRNSDTLGNWRIEVEVSLPTHTEPESEKEMRNFILSYIRHLEYLLGLNEEGLALDVAPRDCLWTASIDIEDFPQDSLFKALIPPSS